VRIVIIIGIVIVVRIVKSVTVIRITIAVTIAVIWVAPSKTHAPIRSVVIIIWVAPISPIPVRSMVKSIPITTIIINVYGNIFRITPPWAVTFVLIIFFNYNVSILI
jgi:hypothetical protein